MQPIVSMMHQYGETAVVHHSDGTDTTVVGFFEPASKSQSKLAPSPLGQRWQDCYTYLGPPDVSINGCVLQWRGRSFGVSHGHLVYLGGEPCHYWALLSPKGENAHDA